MLVENMDVEKLEQLLDAVKQQDNERAQRLYQSIFNETQHYLVEGVEKIADQLHQAMKEFSEDASLLRQTKHELPDATEGLQYVFTETEKASNQTLTAAETLYELLEGLAKKLERDEESKALLDQAMQQVNAIMLAQGFQDLTGQVLKRVMVLITDLEESLKSLIQQAGIDYASIPEKSEEEKRKENEKGVGPNVTQQHQKESVSNQGDVDDLLADLGL